MRLVLKKTSIVLLTTILFLSLGGFTTGEAISPEKLNSTKLSSITNEQEKNIFVFRDGTNLKPIIKSIEEVDQKAKIEELNELSTITVVPSSSFEEGKLVDLVESNYSTSLEATGKDQTILLDDPLNVSKQNDKLMASMMANSFAVSSMESNGAIYGLESESSIYDPWRWDIDQVTNDGKSFSIEEGNHKVKVGIIDSGIDFNHPDLRDNIISAGRSFVEGVTDTQDYLGHGTMVAGTIAANGNIKGVAPKVGLVPYKVFHMGGADSIDVIKAIKAAADDGMDVINLSLGTYKSIKNKEDKAIYKLYEKALKYAEKKGSFVVASAGTETVGFDMSDPYKLAEARGYPGDAQYHMPGGLKSVTTVAATNKDEELSDYSNYGRNVSIAAPGGDYGPLFDDYGIIDVRYMTITTYPTNLPQTEVSQYAGFDKGYEFMIGTSLAAPKVSAVVALIIAEYEEEYGKKPKVNKIQKILYDGATKTEDGQSYGGNIVNAYGSLKLVSIKKYK